MFGLGYVGTVTAACLSSLGNTVVGVDVDPVKLRSIQEGKSPVLETGMDELLPGQVASGRLTATNDVQHAVQSSDIALICVGTPSHPDGSSNFSMVTKVVAEIGSALRERNEDYWIVIRSTLLPGVLEGALTEVLNKATGGVVGSRIHLCNNPEFLRETTAIKDFFHPPMVLVGASVARTAQPVMDLYAHLSCEKIVTNTTVASMVKYASNAFHALKVCFANEIGQIASSLGADGKEVMRVFCKDNQLNISDSYLRPGFAFGGSCLPKDVSALVQVAESAHVDCELLNSILPSNDAHLTRALNRVIATGKRKVGLVGLSFKAGTDDLRNSPQLRLVEMLDERGFEIKIYDPHVRPQALIGANWKFAEQHLPDIEKLLEADVQAFLEHSEVVVLASDVAEQLQGLDAFAGIIVDLRCIS